MESPGSFRKTLRGKIVEGDDGLLHAEVGARALPPTIAARLADGSIDKVRVIGQAAKPATLPYRQNMTLLDVMIAVGGLTDFAAGNRAVLIRAAENNKEYNVRLTDLVKRGDVKANVQVLPGDVIIIPESWF